MAVTQQNYTGNGSTTNYSFTFPYLAETDVGVKINKVTQATTTYSFANATTISFNTAPFSSSNFRFPLISLTIIFPDGRNSIAHGALKLAVSVTTNG